jgi:hypothetical protein
MLKEKMFRNCEKISQTVQKVADHVKNARISIEIDKNLY